MPEELFAPRRDWREGGRGKFSRRDIHMAIMAIRRFGLSDAQREKMKSEAERILSSNPDDKTKLLAIKMFIEMDKIDAHREETQVQRQHNQVMEATAVLRAAMQGDKTREQMAILSEQVCELPVEDRVLIDEAQIAAAEQEVRHLGNGHVDHTSNGAH